jgi:tagaturonate epimerase
MRTLLKKAVQSFAQTGRLSPDSVRAALSGIHGLVETSFRVTERGIFALVEPEGDPLLVVLTRYPETLSGFRGEKYSESESGKTLHLLTAPLDHRNAVNLRIILPWTTPVPLECRESFGMGDRIGGRGAATPGHIEAIRKSSLTPVLAQQSVRENHKTGRTFENVLDDATWSVFREGYTAEWGSDADHLKTIDDIDAAVQAGFTMFTIDPSEKIDNEADTNTDEILSRKFDAFFPDIKKGETFIDRYEGSSGASRREVVKSGVKYLGAIRHAVLAYRHLAGLLGESRFNFELSIDETRTATSVLDHRIIATELALDEVNLFSLAPRFEGDFEKGIDYRGSIEGFRRSLRAHNALSRQLGNYRLSLHSGSDKFSIYPVFGEITDGFYHVKTAGTSYLEAVKTAASEDFGLFRKILSLSIETFAENAASYQISADVRRAPDPSKLSRDEALRLIADDPDVRQVLHIAFGVVLNAMGDELRNTLRTHRETYRRFLVSHIGKHISLLTGR